MDIQLPLRSNPANIFEEGPKEHYLNTSSYDLRCKFLSILLIQMPLSALGGFAYRFCDLIQGNFYYRSMDQDNCEAVLKELLYSVAKCALYIFYCVGVECAAFLGLFCPKFARRMVCTLDQLFYVQPLDPLQTPSIFERMYNLIDSSLQTNEFWFENSLFRLDSEYDRYNGSNNLPIPAVFNQIIAGMENVPTTPAIWLQLKEMEELFKQAYPLATINKIRPHLAYFCDAARKKNFDVASYALRSLKYELIGDEEVRELKEADDLTLCRLNQDFSPFTIDHLLTEIEENLLRAKHLFTKVEYNRCELNLADVRLRFRDVDQQSELDYLNAKLDNLDFDPRLEYLEERDPFQRSLSKIRSELIALNEALQTLYESEYRHILDQGECLQKVFTLLEELLPENIREQNNNPLKKLGLD